MFIRKRCIRVNKLQMMWASFFILVLITGGLALGQPQIAPTVTPTLWYLEPSFGSPGIVVSIYADPTAANPNFGAKMDDDAILIGQEGTWVEVPFPLWTENVVKFQLPGSIFTGDSMVKVRVKKGSIISNVKIFYVRKHPQINSILPSEGPVGSVVTIDGVGFFSPQENFTPADVTIGSPPVNKTYGYSSYIELVASNDKYRSTAYVWSATQIETQFLPVFKLLDVYTGNPVATNDLYRGRWNVYVITDYFIDDGDGKYNEGMTGLDLRPADVPAGNNADSPNATGTGDILLYREISDPIVFTVTD
jgi:hypothetical protein